jgi:hypothetical protein
MPNETESVVLEFDINGTATRREESANTPDQEKEKAVVQRLTEKEAATAQALQRELTQVFEPFASGRVTVLADVKFVYSTVGLEALIIAILAQTIAQAVGQPLGKLLESRVRWFFRERHNEIFGNDAPDFEPIEVQVGSPRIIQQPTTAQATPQTRLEEVRGFQSGVGDTPHLQISQLTNSQPHAEEARGAQGTRSNEWLIRAVGVGTTVIIVVLAVLLTMIIMQTG